jgi:hypothetical protein
VKLCVVRCLSATGLVPYPMDVARCMPGAERTAGERAFGNRAILEPTRVRTQEPPGTASAAGSHPLLCCTARQLTRRSWRRAHAGVARSRIWFANQPWDAACRWHFPSLNG